MEFDPYAEWLQIAADHRPPNHYELLGLPAFTDDTEAIRAASMRRSGHVRKFCLGKRGDEANRILGELAGAMVCLTDPVRKLAYDQALRGAATVNLPISANTTRADVSQALPLARVPTAVISAAPKRSTPPRPAVSPFDAEQALARQQEWADYLGLPVQHENTAGMKFVLIPPGEFLMGSTAEEIKGALKGPGGNDYWKAHIRSEAPQHKVILTRPIYLAVHQVAQKDYEAVMGKNPSRFSATGPGKGVVAGLDTSKHPVEQVSWSDAAEFCAKLSEQEKLKPFYIRKGETAPPLDGTGYRLPTEAEWEFACRAGTTTRFWIGDRDEQLAQAAWFSSNSSGRTHAVGELAANPFGLFDMHGNVSEWVQDGWEPTYYAQFQDKPALDPSGPTSAGARRVLRGGDWHFFASDCRASRRNVLAPASRVGPLGFRLALTIGASPGGH